jgi:hypothetical protein
MFGDIAGDIFEKTGLARPDLEHVWNLTNRRNEGRLDMDGFAIAMHLLFRTLYGHQLPRELPPELELPATDRPPYKVEKTYTSFYPPSRDLDTPEYQKLLDNLDHGKIIAAAADKKDAPTPLATEESCSPSMITIPSQSVSTSPGTSEQDNIPKLQKEVQPSAQTHSRTTGGVVFYSTPPELSALLFPKRKKTEGHHLLLKTLIFSKQRFRIWRRKF